MNLYYRNLNNDGRHTIQHNLELTIAEGKLRIKLCTTAKIGHKNIRWFWSSSYYPFQWPKLYSSTADNSCHLPPKNIHIIINGRIMFIISICFSAYINICDRSKTCIIANATFVKMHLNEKLIHLKLKPFTKIACQVYIFRV